MANGEATEAPGKKGYLLGHGAFGGFCHSLARIVCLGQVQPDLGSQSRQREVVGSRADAGDAQLGVDLVAAAGGRAVLKNDLTGASGGRVRGEWGKSEGRGRGGRGR